MYVKKFNHLAIAGIIAASGLLMAWPAQAELQRVEQLIYGMDCAPCAYGTERRIQGIDGVTKVELSLNKGTVEIALEPSNRVTLHQIRDQVRRGGFSPQEAQIVVMGKLEIDPKGDRLLVTGTAEDFRLAPVEQIDGSQAWEKLEQMEPGQRLVIQGQVPKSKPEEPVTLVLHVQEVSVLSEEV